MTDEWTRKHVVCNPAEAPDGYLAVLKSTVAVPDPETGRVANLCRKCDYRQTCQTDTLERHLQWGHRCADYPVVSADGVTYQRDDKASVVFKARKDPKQTDLFGGSE